MAISYSITKHNWGFPSKIASSAGSPHIYNIRLTADHDNLTLVGRGSWIAFDEYQEAAVPTTGSGVFAGIIREKAANGNWYIEVTADTDALLVWNSPVIAEDFTKEFQKEENFYNKSGETVKAYSLIKGDIFEVSATGFTGTPAANTAVTYSAGKYVVGS